MAAKLLILSPDHRHRLTLLSNLGGNHSLDCAAGSVELLRTLRVTAVDLVLLVVDRALYSELDSLCRQLSTEISERPLLGIVDPRRRVPNVAAMKEKGKMDAYLGGGSWDQDVENWVARLLAGERPMISGGRSGRLVGLSRWARSLLAKEE
jgi:hypothetical protein